jgi:hypothetical protein
MTIVEINKLLGTNYSSIELFEKNATWNKDIKGKSIKFALINQFPQKIDWDYLSLRYNLPEEFIRSNIDRVNWANISQSSLLSESFIREFKDEVSWLKISKFQLLSENFIEEFQNRVKWDEIIVKQKLSESFIEKHINKFNINSILIFQDISYSFIERNKQIINWASASYWFNKIKNDEQKIELLKKYEKFLKWERISRDWNLSIELINPFVDKVVWSEINKQSSLSEDFIRAFKDKLDWKNISQNCKLSEEFIEEFKDRVDWNYIGENIEYTLPFIIKHKDKLKNAKISTNDISIIRELKNSISFKGINYLDFSEELLYEFRDKINWETIIKHKKLSETLFDKVTEFFGEWEWRWLSDVQPLSEYFIRKHHKKVHWGGICMNQILSEEFIEEFDIINQPFTPSSDKLPIFYMGKLCSPYHIWWGYILKYQKLSNDFCKKISSDNWSKRIYSMLPYQKNDYTIQFINTLSEEDKKKYLADTWLYESIDFRKKHILNLNLFECFSDYFITSILVDTNRYQPYNYHCQFDKNKTFEIFATQTDERSSDGFERAKGYIVVTFDNLIKYYNIDIINSKKKFITLKVKVFYEDVARIINKKENCSNQFQIVRCKRITVLD